MEKSTSTECVMRLVDEFFDLRNQGVDVSVEQLCKETPHLTASVAKEIAAIKQMEELLDSCDRDDESECTVGRPLLGQRGGMTTASSSYLIRKLHAHGGSSEVYIADDKELGRTVAVKFLRPDVENDNGFRLRLQREAEITSRLDHPGIVSVLSQGQDDSGRPFYTMRFVDGDSLADRIETLHAHPNPFDSSDFRKIINHFVDVCQTIAFAHSREVIHRDIKPANIAIGNFGETFLIDWGLARYVAAEPDDTPAVEISPDLTSVDTQADSLTQFGNVIGTPAYMSPEQANGHAVGKPADIFGLGATLFAILTGKPPYDSASLIQVIQDAKTASVSDLNRQKPRMPRPLIAICMRAMDADPVKRYPSARQLADDVESFLAGGVVAAYRESGGELLLRWVKRNRTLVTTVVTTCLAATLILSVATWLLVDANQSLARRESEAIELRAKTNEALTEATENLYAQQISLAHSEINKNNVVRAGEILNRCPHQYRSWEWHLLQSMIEQHRPGISISTDGHIARCLTFSNDSSRMAIGQSNGQVRLIELFGDETEVFDVSHVLDDCLDISAIAFSPDAKRLVVCGSEIRNGKSSGAIRIWDLQSKAIAEKRWGHGNNVHTVAWSDDGLRIATGGSVGGVRIRDAKTLEPTLRIRQAHAAAIRSIAFLDGSNDRVVTTGEDGAIKTWNAVGLLVENKDAHAGGSNCLTLANGSLFTGGNDNLIRRWNGGDDLQPNRFYVGNEDHVVAIDVSPDGRYIASGGLDRNVRVWEADSGRLIAMLRRHTSHVRCVKFDPQGNYLVTSGDDGGVNIWRTSGLLEASPTGHIAAFSRVSPQLLCLSGSELAIWEPGNHSPLLRRNDFDSRPVAVAMANNGNGFVVLQRNGIATLYDSEHKLNANEFPKHTSRPLHAVFTKDDANVVVACRDGTIASWNRETARTIHSGSSAGPPSGIGISADQNLIVCGSYNGKLTTWDSQTLENNLSVRAHPRHVLAIAIHPTDSVVATTGKDGTVKIWNIENGEQMDSFRFGASWLNCLAFTPDGKRLVTGSEHTILFWDIQKRQEVLSMAVDRCVHSISFSHDGQYMAVAGEDPQIRIWRVGGTSALQASAAATDSAFSSRMRPFVAGH